MRCIVHKPTSLTHALYQQDKESTTEDISIKGVYVTMWEICKLRRMFQIIQSYR